MKKRIQYNLTREYQPSIETPRINERNQKPKVGVISWGIGKNTFYMPITEAIKYIRESKTFEVD
jgi:hypothetical protein